MHFTNDTINDIIADVETIVERMRREPQAIRFTELRRVCDHCFGPPRQSGSSHRVYKTPWVGDPRVNVQNSKGMAKTY